MTHDHSTITGRLFLLGAGFSRPAGLPLANELIGLVLDVARRHFQTPGGYSHLEAAYDRFLNYTEDVDPGQPFDIERFSGWLDWEHTLRLKGSDTFSEHGNEAGLQLRWAIGKVLYEATPQTIPDVYLDFFSQLNTSDRVLTLNYDLLAERAMDEVGLPFRRFPDRFKEINEYSSIVDSDQPEELILSKLHGSLDWTWADRTSPVRLAEVEPLVEGPRQPDDPLSQIAVFTPDGLVDHYTRSDWYGRPNLLLPPSTAKPLAGSPLVPFWDGVGLYSYMLGGFSVIGCSLPPGDPYVLQLVHHVATDYIAGKRRGGNLRPQRRMHVVDYRTDDSSRAELLRRFRFFDHEETEWCLDGFNLDCLTRIFAE